jgi:ketosteroid isomerase-like protein
VATNADIVRRGFDALTAGDLDALLATLHEDVYWRPLMSRTPGEDAFRGHEGVTEWWRRIHGITPDVRSHIDDLVEQGDFVYVEGGLGTGGADLPAQTMAWVVRLRQGKVERMDVFTDRDEARAAAGLDQ